MTWATDNAWWRANAAKRRGERRDQCIVRAWLSAPVAWDGYDPLTLEGALQSVVVARETGRMPCDVFRGCPVDAPLTDSDIPIPIADIDVEVDGSSMPLALCSVGLFSPDAAPTVRYIRGRARAEQYATKMVNIAMAEYKSSNMPIATVTCCYVEFRCVGDADQIRDLLRDVDHIGADRSGGLGAVQGWELEVDEDSGWGPFKDSHGRLLRSIPDSMEPCGASGFEVRLATLRAPYWHKRTQTLCKVPIVQVGA